MVSESMRPYVTILLVFCLACEEEDATKIFSVQGRVLIGGSALPGVMVMIDDDSTAAVRADSAGNYHIEGISKGHHIVSFTWTSQPEESPLSPFIKRIVEVNLIDDTDLGTISMSVPITGVVAKQTSSSVLLRWTSLDTDDFRLYILYEDSTANISTLTSTRLFTSADATDTSFTDRYLQPNNIYYYRVFALTAGGEQVASNVIEVNTTEDVRGIEAITNGSFEIVESGQPVGWELFTALTSTVTLSTGNASHGQNSIKFHYGQVCYVIGARHTIKRELVTPGGRFRVTFKYKGETGVKEILVHLKTPGGAYGNKMIVNFTPQWQSAEMQVVVPPDLGTSDLGFIINVQGGATCAGDWYFDEISMVGI